MGIIVCFLLSVVGSNDDTPKETDTKDTNDTNSTEDDRQDNKEKAKASLNLQAGGIKVDSDGNWGAGNLEINNLKPNEAYTLIGEFTYTYFSIMENKMITESSKMAIDIVADENGSAMIKRLGIVGEYTGKNELKRYEDGKLNIEMKLSLAEGTVKDNYQEIDKPTNEELTSAENKTLREKYGLGYYGMFHASQERWVEGNKTQEYNGGGVSGQADPKSSVEILNENIEFDTETSETKTSEKVKNDAKGRY